MWRKAKNRARYHIKLDQYFRQGWKRDCKGAYPNWHNVTRRKRAKCENQTQRCSIFLTGSKFLSSNISNGTFLFNHQTEEGRRIKIGTCLYSIEFPVSRRYCGDNFSRNFIEYIIQFPRFGQEWVFFVLWKTY